MNLQHFYTDTITVYTVTESVSTATGENIKTNSTGISVKCKIRPLTNRELFLQNKVVTDATHRVYCEPSTVFDGADRILFNSVQYEIVGVTNPFNKGNFWQVDVKAII